MSDNSNLFSVYFLFRIGSISFLFLFFCFSVFSFRLFLILIVVALSILHNGQATADFSVTGTRMNVGLSEDEQIVLEPINGTRDYRINSKKDADDKPWFDGSDLRFIHCVRPAKCERLHNNTCFGSKLPYLMTSLALTDSKTQEESREKLYNYEALRNIPKCWAVIQVKHTTPQFSNAKQ